MPAKRVTVLGSRVPSWVMRDQFGHLPSGGCNLTIGLCWTPSTGAFSASNATNGIATSRAQTGTLYALNPDGTLASFPNPNTLRETGNGLLPEEARTNVCLQSQALTSATWSRTGVTASASATPAPDGTTTAQRVQLNAGAQNSVFVQQSGISAAASQTHTFAFYAMATSGTQKFSLKIAEGLTAGGFTNHFSSDQTATGQWQRFSFSQAFGSGSNGTAVIGIAGDAAGDAADLIVWQCDFNANASFATSPIPTTTTSVTRNPDIYTLQGALLAAAKNAQSEYVKLQGVNSSVSGPRMISYSGGGNILFSGSSAVSIFNGTNFATATLGSGSWSSTVKAAFGSGSSMTAIGNGGTKVTSANAWTGNTGTVTIGDANDGSRACNCYVQEFWFSTTFGAFDQKTSWLIGPWFGDTRYANDNDPLRFLRTG